MKFWTIYFVYVLCFIIVGWGFNLIGTYIHEQVHVAIFNNYNISSIVKINWLTGEGVTIPNYEQYKLYCNEQCKFSHSLNEIIGYNINTLALAILCFIFVIGFIVINVAAVNRIEEWDSFYNKYIKNKNINNGGELTFAELSDLME
jgi:hypothetical protein